ncbi:MAG: hypothetical protein KDG50_13035 [Chromatiales bacterium]|nr:hypothetical protein [Chromatiales bacterium]
MFNHEASRAIVTVCVAGALVLAAGCTAPAMRDAPAMPEALASCHARLVDADRRHASAGTTDAQSTRVPGFPHLRTNRFLASLRKDLTGPEHVRAWIEAMRKLDAEARGIEALNAGGSAQELTERLDCATRLAAFDSTQPDRVQRLRDSAGVADNYRGAWRVLGLYPLTRIAVRSGADRLRNEVTAAFARGPAATPARRYRPAVTAGDAHGHVNFAAVARDPLGRPRPEPAVLDALFARHAPIIEADSTADADRIGRPAWRSASAPAATLDTNDPVVYALASYTRFDARVLLQLNYVFWFPERPRAGAFDLLGGHLDGLTWRVTLDDDGSPLLYDTMHNCGCYHWFFPAPRLIARAEQAPLADEGALIPAAAPTLNSAQRIVLRLETGTHFITGVSAGSAAGGLNYRLADYDDLRRLPLPEGGSRSLFGPHGFVAGTERAERFVLWPMGIERPGAMRQWGHHATAFIGRRHFDEARLIERYFERAP